MNKYLQLMRPHQWVKNIFVFLPLFFSGKLLDYGLMMSTLVLFIAYCLISSSVYCLNDILDVEHDRLHPSKRNRPIASGDVPRQSGYILMSICILAGFFLLFITDASPRLFFVVGFYFLMNMVYCIRLKYFALIDVFIISLGFVLRVVAGGLSTDVRLSHWIVLMTFLLALFLAFAKRRDDLAIYERTGVVVRKNVVKYNADFLNAALIISPTITIVAYIMYTVSPEVMAHFNSEYLYTTTLFVLMGILRYLQLSFVLGLGGSPTKVVLQDRFLQCCLLGWIGMFVMIVYL